MTLARWDLPTFAVDKDRLIRVPHRHIEFVYHHDWYAGPVSGKCKMAGKAYWFELFEEALDVANRHFALFDLPDSEWAKFGVVDGFRPNLAGLSPVGWF